MIGIFVNSKDIPFAKAIVYKMKPIETRNKNMLAACVGRRVQIIETGKGQPMVVGSATITHATYESAAWLAEHRDLTWITAGSKYDTTGPGKWCYHLSNQKPCKPYALPAYAIRHGMSWAEWTHTGKE